MRLLGRRPKGPNLAGSAAMDRFIGELDHLNEAQLLALKAARAVVDERAHTEAWVEVRAVGRRDGLRAAIDAVRERAMDWATAPRNQAPMYYIPGDGIFWDRLRQETAPALVDAAVALALGDRLSERTRDTLGGPWVAALGRAPGEDGEAS